MLSQRLRIERFGGLRIGYHATNMLLRDAPPGQFSDHIALRGIRHESFSPAAAGHSRHEFSLLEMEPLRRYLPTMLILYHVIACMSMSGNGRAVSRQCMSSTKPY